MQVGRITKVLTGWLLSKCDPLVRPYIGSRAWGSPKMNLLELVQRKEEGDVNPAERWIYSSSSLRKKLHGCMAAKLFGFNTLQRLLKKTRKVWAKNDWREGWWATCTWSWSSWVLRRRLGGWESWWGSMDGVHAGASGSRDIRFRVYFWRCCEGLLINDLSSFIGFLMERGYIFWKIKRKLLEFLEASADRNSRFSWYRTIV